LYSFDSVVATPLALIQTSLCVPSTSYRDRRQPGYPKELLLEAPYSWQHLVTKYQASKGL